MPHTTPSPTTLVLLVGEQPAPNLLPTRHIQPESVALVYTDHTQRVARNLQAILSPQCECHLCQVDAYHLESIEADLTRLLCAQKTLSSATFNLTGGTKPMSLAAFQVAQAARRPFVYFQSQGNVSKLLQYTFDDAGRIVVREPVDLPTSMSLDDYLRLYLREYTTGDPRDPLEVAVVDTLRATPGVDEVFTSLRPEGMPALEIDFILRCGNQVAIGEVKSSGGKKAIDQLNGVAQQRYLGAYIRKFLVSGKPVDSNNHELAKAYRTQIIELPSYGDTRALSPADRALLAERVQKHMGVHT